MREDDRNRVFFRSEVGAESPLWDAEGHIIELDELTVPQSLASRLATWAQIAWAEDNPDLHVEGRVLLAELETELGAQYQFVWDGD